MAMQIIVQGRHGETSGIRDIRSVGSKVMPIRVQVTNNREEVIIKQTPTSTGEDSMGHSTLLPLGKIDPGGGTIVIDEPVDYILVELAHDEDGPVDAYVSTSR